MIRKRFIFFLFLAAYLYFFVGGIISYRLANYFTFTHYDFNYQINLTQAGFYALLALLSFVLAYVTFSYLRIRPHQAELDERKEVSPPTAYQVAALMAVFFIGCVGLVLMMKQYGWQIPIFTEGSDEFRTKIESGLPQILYFQLMVSTLIAYALLSGSPHSRFSLILKLVIALSLFFIFLGASRSMLFTPVVIILLDLWRKKLVRFRWIAFGTIFSGLAIFLIGLFRMGTQAERGIYLLRFVNDFAPEFREFAKLLQYIPDKAGYLNGQMFLNTIFILLPGKILSLLGMSKAEHWLPFGQYLKDLFQYRFQGGGLRAGLIAEYYANFGLVGVIAGFYLLGVLIRYFDAKIHVPSPVWNVFYLTMGLSVATSVLFTFDAVVYKIVSLSIGWILYYGFSESFRTISTVPKEGRN